MLGDGFSSFAQLIWRVWQHTYCSSESKPPTSEPQLEMVSFFAKVIIAPALLVGEMWFFLGPLQGQNLSFVRWKSLATIFYELVEETKVYHPKLTYYKKWWKLQTNLWIWWPVGLPGYILHVYICLQHLRLRLQESLALMDLGPGSPKRWSSVWMICSWSVGGGAPETWNSWRGKACQPDSFFWEDEYLVKNNSKCNCLLLLVFDGWLMSK